MTPFPEARARVLANVAPLGTERISEYAGQTIAQSLVCPFDVPHFDNSQVDGYAVRSGDSGSRRAVGVSAAGGAVPPSVGPGEAVRIFTGAPIPIGADAVVMQEDVRREGGVVWLDTPLSSGDSIRRQGEEIAEGTSIDLRGWVATPPLVGLIASFGITEVEVFRQPRVIVVGTGSELVKPGEPLGPGQIYASNPPALEAALRAMGLRDVESRLVGDEADLTDVVLDRALADADVLITVGGVSVGEHDLVRPTLARLGVEEILWRVAMKPGKPFFMGRLGAKTVFGLPGNPVSTLVTFALLVRPAIRKTLGTADAEEETTAGLGTRIERKDLRYEFVRATLRGGIATPVSAQGSHMQTGLAFADALIHVPDGIAALEQGETVTVTPLRWSV